MKIIICSTDVYVDLNEDERSNFKEMMNRGIERGDIFVFTANKEEKINVLEGIEFNKNIYFINRSTLKEKIKNSIKIHNQNFFIIVGNREADLFMAAANKVFYVKPGWCSEYDGVVLKYGVTTRNVKALEKLIDIVENHANWYYRVDIDDKTTVLSLTNAGTYGKHSDKELDMIEKFREVLKDGKKNLQEVLLVHFLAAISNKIEFRDIKDWAIMPSSGVELNEDMLLFKEKARELMNGRKPEPIFIRHTATLKSHERYKNGVNRYPCDRHFDTIILNPKYKGKLKGRVVCVFDDYSTYGTTFEVARNILLNEKVEKIFFVSLGKFGKKHLKQNYNLKGDVSKPGYSYEKISEEWLMTGNTNNEAIKEIEQLYDILYN